MSKLKKKALKWAIKAHESTVNVNDMRYLNDVKSASMQAEIMSTFREVAGVFFPSPVQSAPSDGIQAKDLCNCDACQAARAKAAESMKSFDKWMRMLTDGVI